MGVASRFRGNSIAPLQPSRTKLLEDCESPIPQPLRSISRMFRSSGLERICLASRSSNPQTLLQYVDATKLSESGVAGAELVTISVNSSC
ncbi:hypothetical protein TgHK011_003321 [Trichoderma gracile]|nr:hypothetical protein TgHK011_003321 [Trichoderma gracile]